MKQITVNKYSQRKHDQLSSVSAMLVESEAKNPFPTSSNNISATDVIGLSWIFRGEDDYF